MQICSNVSGNTFEWTLVENNARPIYVPFPIVHCIRLLVENITGQVKDIEFHRIEFVL